MGMGAPSIKTKDNIYLAKAPYVLLEKRVKVRGSWVRSKTTCLAWKPHSKENSFLQKVIKLWSLQVWQDFISKGSNKLTFGTFYAKSSSLICVKFFWNLVQNPLLQILRAVRGDYSIFWKLNHLGYFGIKKATSKDVRVFWYYREKQWCFSIWFIKVKPSHEFRC